MLALLMVPTILGVETTEAPGALGVLNAIEINREISKAKRVADLVQLHVEQGEPTADARGGLNAMNMANLWERLAMAGSRDDLEQSRDILRPICETTIKFLAETGVAPSARQGLIPAFDASEVTKIAYTMASKGMVEGSPWRDVWLALPPATVIVLPDMQAPELAAALWSFAKSGFAVPALFEGMVTEMVPKLETLTPRQLRSVAWSIATAGEQTSHTSPLFFEKLANVVIADLHNFLPIEIANVAWAYATSGVAAPELFEAIALHSAPRIYEYDATSLATLSWAFASLRHGVPYFPRTLFDAIAKEAVPQLYQFSPQELTNLAWSFAILGHSAPSLFDAIGTQALSYLPPSGTDRLRASLKDRPLLIFNPQEFASLAWSYAVFGLADPASEKRLATSGDTLFASERFTERAEELTPTFSLDELGQLAMFEEWRGKVVANHALPWPELPETLQKMIRAAGLANQVSQNLEKNLVRDRSGDRSGDRVAGQAKAQCPTRRRMLMEWNMPTALGTRDTPTDGRIVESATAAQVPDEESWYQGEDAPTLTCGP